MKIISLSEISTKVFSVSSGRVWKRRPGYKGLVMENRRVNGFYLLEEGECVYSWEGGSVHLRPGSLLYLPLGSNHKMEVIRGDICYTAINFVLKDQEGDILLFSEKPLLISRHIGNYFMDHIHRMTEQYLENADNFKNIAAISLFLSEFCAQKNMANRKVAPAISYINSNLLEPINGSTLASLCGLSKAQMYRLFKEETGMTPTEYRNKNRIEKACQMLATREYYVYEVATELGFENIGYFNRVFKEYMGLAPKDYLT
ncbi:MAG: helix-turn-helix transcriptional regulator [Oscillospiraceae bacterium]|nr:helix-turn-helix transcriptional regulator [Oscillospiraceae bacterium]